MDLRVRTRPSINMIKVGSTVTGGTYSTTLIDPETGNTIKRTWNYNQTMLEQPISETNEFVQAEVIGPNAHWSQFAGAKVMSLETAFMNDVHHPEIILNRWKDSVGRTKVDTLVGTGVSGTIAVINLARDLGINYLIVRKDAESAHSSFTAEGRLGKNWVFVDDCVSTGSTFSRVWDVMEGITQRGFGSTYKGTFLYQDFEYEDFVTPRSKIHHRWLREGNSTTFGQPKKELAW